MRGPAPCSPPTRCGPWRTATTAGRRPASGASRGYVGRWACSGWRAQSPLQVTLPTDLHHIPHQPDPLHSADQQATRIERQLPPAEPVRGRRWEGMVVVVPGLAEREHRQPGDIGGLVGGVEAAPAEEVADRVDAPG